MNAFSCDSTELPATCTFAWNDGHCGSNEISSGLACDGKNTDRIFSLEPKRRYPVLSLMAMIAFVSVLESTETQRPIKAETTKDAFVGSLRWWNWFSPRVTANGHE